MAHTVTRGLSALALGGFMTLSLAGPAWAADPTPVSGQCPAGYTVSQDGTTCSPGTQSGSTVDPGGTITIVAPGFGPNSPVTITVCGKPYTTGGPFSAGSDGTFSGTVTVPSDTSAGSCTIVVSGTGPNGAARAVSFPITVTSSGTGGGSGNGGGGLPFTGFELGAASVLGAGLLGAGTIALIAGRKRKDGLNAA